MKSPVQKSTSKKGFALIVSLTLMSFLLLLVMTLVTLTSLETRSTTNTRHNIEAEQNALTALNIALGELQKYAGPDQRITARGDLQHGAGSAGALWTGVYGSSIAADYDATPEQIATDLTDPLKVDSKGSPAQLLSWLVSGNESIPFDPSTDIGASGEIINTPLDSSVPFKANTTISNLDSATATSTNISIQSTSGTSRPARLLVGPGSANSSSGYVAAPLVNLEGNANNTTGRYAWWIGDEGIKARANLPLVTKDEDKLNAFVNATRTAVELMSDGSDDEKLDGPRIDTSYSPLSTLSRTDLLSDLTLSSPNPNSFENSLKHRFHDVTTHSQSLLIDTYAGGFKRDLSILLDESYTPEADDPTFDDNRLWVPHSGDTTGFIIPTWKHLRSFAQTRVPTTGADAFMMEPILPANDKEGFGDHVGVAPVLTYASIGFRVAPAAEPAAGVGINMNIYPLFVIWNPYNFTIKAPDPSPEGGNYEVGVYPTYAVTMHLEAFVPIDPNDPNSNGDWEKRGFFDFQRQTDGDWSKSEYIRFRLDCPDIPPGQSLIFSLPHTSIGEIYNQKNILKNIDPEENSYVSIPMTYGRHDVGTEGKPIRIKAGEDAVDYKLQSYSHGRSFSDYGLTNQGTGEIYAYLGEPVSGTVRVGYPHDDPHVGHNPSHIGRRWYNTHQRTAWTRIKVKDNMQQAAGQLVYDQETSEPSFVFLMQALFSGEGMNSQLNTDQHMFTTRWIAQGNMRTVRSSRTLRDGTFNPLFTATAGSPTVNTPWKKFQNGEGSESHRSSSGHGHDWIGTPPEPVDAILFEFPYENQNLLSIGQLQHANLSLIGGYPSYPIGNSLADYHLPDNSQTPVGGQLARIDAGDRPYGGTKVQLGKEQKAYYDISFLLNRMLWDRYFFSSVPATGNIPETLPNPRHVRDDLNKDLRNPDESAVGLILNGGFNINSTSEQAWRAVLGGTNQLEFNPESSSTGSSLSSAFSRFTRPTSDDAPNDVWEGYRTLTEEQIAQLARNIVTEIRNRGPFISLSDFINRRLVDNPETSDSTDASDKSYEHEHFRGTIQAAIDRTTVIDEDENQFAVNDGSEDIGNFWFDDKITSNLQQSQFDIGAYEKAMIQGGDVTERPYSNRSAFAPKYLTQADILTSIGSSLTARSDTFIIRTYGEVVNPFAPDDVKAQAWCEAVVQRNPEYLNSSVDNPEDDPSHQINSQFGRQFKILSFRWLSADEV